MSIKLEMKPAQQIILRLKLQKGGPVQKFFASEVARMCDPYVPMETGMLKTVKDVTAEYIHYKSPYARRQYYENKGGHNGPLRGKQWDKRMWADRGNEIVRSVAKYAGGRT